MAFRLYAANSPVVLQLTSGRDFISPDWGYALAHDEFGEYERACSFFLVPLLSEQEAARSRVRTLARGYPYWTSGGRAFPGWLAIPDHGWQRMDSVKTIWYSFPGTGRSVHTFSPRAVSLYTTSSPLRAWRIGLGSGCVADENGFQIP